LPTPPPNPHSSPSNPPPSRHRYIFPEHGDPHAVYLQWETKRTDPIILPPTSFKDLLQWDLSRIIPIMDPSNSIFSPSSPSSPSTASSFPSSSASTKTVQTQLLTTSKPTHPPMKKSNTLQDKNSEEIDSSIDFEVPPWKNRIVHGDSLLGLHALVQAGYGNRIQMVYMDPPYGIDYNAKVQMGSSAAEGYIDTWKLGLGSYLEHLRERFLIVQSLLHPTGSIFVQIGQKNLHYVRCLMDEIFGTANCVNVITYRTAISTNNVSNIADHLLWYAKDKAQVFQRRLYCDRSPSKVLKTFTYSQTDPTTGKVTKFKPQEIVKKVKLGASPFSKTSKIKKNSRKSREPRMFSLMWKSIKYFPPKGYEWRWKEEAMNRLLALDRVQEINGKLYGKRFETDFPKMLLTNVWTDTSTSTFAAKKHYSVHTNPKVIQRCIAMTTRPGDLIVDPTAGSGTTAVVAEKLGRRWIVFDTSALAIYSTLHWLSGSVFDKFKWNGETGEYIYKQIPKISLSNLAQDRVSPMEFQYDNPVVERKKRRLSSKFILSTLDREEIPQKWSAKWLKEKIITNGFLRITGESSYVKNLQLTDIDSLECDLEGVEEGKWIFFQAMVDGNPWLIVCLPPIGSLHQLKILQIVPKLCNLSQFSQVVLVTGQFQFSLGTLRKLYKYRNTDLDHSAALTLGYFHQDLWTDHLNLANHSEAICLSSWIEDFLPDDSTDSKDHIKPINFHIISLADSTSLSSVPNFGATWWIVPQNLSDGYLSAEVRTPSWIQIPGYSSFIDSSIKRSMTRKIVNPKVWSEIKVLVAPESSMHLCILDRRGIFHYGFLGSRS